MSAPRTTKPALDAAPATAESKGYSGADRRRHPRQRHEVSATLQPASGSADADETAQVFDLSLGGVGLICERRFQTGSVWRITMGNGPLLLNAKIRVVSCRPRKDDDGRFDVGCQFC